MHPRQYFPLGIASGAAFCNRTEETARLCDNIRHCKHTLLIATRRYGKSSLALHAIQQSQQPYVEIDFFMASNEEMIQHYILNAVVELIGKSIGSIDKLITHIKNYVKHLKPKINIGSDTFKLELSVDAKSDPASNVKEALQLLEKLLQDHQKQAVILMDEFQTVGIIAEGKGIEAAIRHVAQKTKHLTFIFSGSQRNLLQTMFEDANRPLYKLCSKLSLTRISEAHYRSHLDKAANYIWGKSFDAACINLIIQKSERHPFYFNKLCDNLLALHTKQPPTSLDVEAAWNDIIAEEKSDAIKDIANLPLGQKKLLAFIATQNIPQLTSKQAILHLEMTSSTIIGAIQALDDKDIIEYIDHQYQIINPIIKHYVLTYA